MITIFASLVGFIGSIIPEVLKFLKDKSDKSHELNVLDRQIKYTKNNVNQDIQEISLSKEVLDQAILYSTYKSGNHFIDGLNGSVRPVLAYSFFLMYAFVKVLQYKAIANTHQMLEYLGIIWNVDDQAIFAGIISFYFGQRTFSKLWNRR